MENTVAPGRAAHPDGRTGLPGKKNTGGALAVLRRQCYTTGEKVLQVNGIRCQADGLFSNRALVRLIFPLVMEQALAALVGMCDGVMVSAVGEAAISGVSLVDMINNVILNLFAALLPAAP